MQGTLHKNYAKNKRKTKEILKSWRTEGFGSFGKNISKASEAKRDEKVVQKDLKKPN